MENKYVPPEILLERIKKRLSNMVEDDKFKEYNENIIDLTIVIKTIEEELKEIRKMTTYMDLLHNHLETIKLLEWYRTNYNDHSKKLLEAIDNEIARRTNEIDKILLTRKDIPIMVEE